MLYFFKHQDIWSPSNVNALIAGQSIGFTKEKFEHIKKTSQLDILILGSSRAYRCIDPSIFKSKNVYNLGTTNQTPMNTYYILKQLIKTHHIKQLILDIHYKSFESKDGAESCTDLIDASNINCFEMAFCSKNIASINQYLAHVIYKPQIYASQKDDSLMPNGLVINSKTNIYTSFKIPLKEPQIQEIQKNYIEKIASLCSSKQIKLNFIIGPYHSRIESGSKNYIHIKKWISSQFKDQYYITDYKGQFDDMFYDEYHLNTHGVTLYNSYLKSILD